MLRELGLLQVAQGRPTEALAFYRRSVRAALPENDHRSACRSYQYMAELYRARHQPDSSIYYARKALRLGQQLPFVVGIVRNSKLLTAIFESQRQPDSTLKYMRLLLTAQDSLHNPRRIKQLDAIGFAEQQRLRELEAERKQFEGTCTPPPCWRAWACCYWFPCCWAVATASSSTPTAACKASTSR
ncbi:tetratricopeptide repeat protein [Hymenobacter sp. 5516J-16]|uniref:tetratricopeptide repeat protein n=1 Tax=Hymenobacter sp. 5516J-16 TaxID=2932253 RepID=UPI001FD20D4B|nr:tetratricopeptide repeat protein [Hymenobacter sp. 5516J-16]UOQ77276.1 tetratricopeptide repeat protein [Hymenobacter sp. 5516J-16]